MPSAPRNLARAALGRLPARGSAPPEPPAQREVVFPPDVADREATRDYLLETTYSSGSRAEIEAYIADALDRFRVTMALVPPLQAGARVLELGSSPYFLTRLLKRRGLDVTCANWFGPGHGTGGGDLVERSALGEEVYFEYDHFNVETDRFPYPDESFDIVLCCEILEHLPHDPVQMLAEIHRVLRRDSGTLLLTTPNAARMMNLVLMLRGENVYEQLSGYGIYGRHNREYTVSELERLFAEAGYRVNEIFARDVHANQRVAAPGLPGVELSHRGDNLFATASPFGRARWPYHDWLYASQHNIRRRVVYEDVVMGENGYLQTAGLHSVEQIGGPGGTWVSWTGGAPRAEITLAPGFAGPAELVIEGIGPPPPVGPSLTLFAGHGGQEHAWQVQCNGDHFRVAVTVEAAAGPQVVNIWTDRTWVPQEVGMGDDRRHLGVALATIGLRPARP